MNPPILLLVSTFNVNGEEENGFFFGLATVPAHVEDKLNDAWVQFAEENPCHKSETSDDPMEADAVIGVTADGGSHCAPLARKGSS
ncbi:hypothetical protein V6N13_043529 [Hibiscus sabdariffa]|uniref:Carboxylesterase type B domain-containing protein n=1 Tax=Hibiscus sabdariffa TaxID=183260 RepID=A0ABR2G1H4_9ROSI